MTKFSEYLWSLKENHYSRESTVYLSAEQNNTIKNKTSSTISVRYDISDFGLYSVSE